MTKFERLKEFLKATFVEARFDDEDDYPILYCSDSNASVNIEEIALKIVEILR